MKYQDVLTLMHILHCYHLQVLMKKFTLCVFHSYSQVSK